MDDVMPLRRRVKRQKKCRIDGLPDELLIAILSCLNFHEAARTCILSRRWRYLWKHTTCSLEFYSEETYKIRQAERFITSVNEVLKLHQGAFIEQFKVDFIYPIDCVAGEQREEINCAIDGCIDFAIGKQVKVFELNLASRHLGNGSAETYSIPHVQKLLSISGEVKLQRTLLTLKSVRFVKVGITQEVVEFLLSNCPFLEQVCISASDSLENLEVGGSLPKLRSMEISHCKYLKSVKVRAPSLVSFTYITLGCMFTLPPFEEVPLLSKLTIGGEYARSFLLVADMHSSYCRNLKKLKVEVTSEVSFYCKKIPNAFPQLCHLKKLELDITTRFGDSLCSFTFLTKCSPQLSRLTIRLRFLPIYPYYRRYAVRGHGTFNDDFEELMAEERKTDRIAQEAMTFCHKCLKVVKMVGFIGSPGDCELALHLLRITGSLKRMILCSETGFDRLNVCLPPSLRKKAIRECVDQLKANLPPKAELLTYGLGFLKK